MLILYKRYSFSKKIKIIKEHEFYHKTAFLTPESLISINNLSDIGHLPPRGIAIVLRCQIS